MSVSLTRARSNPKARIVSTNTTAPATMTSPRPWGHHHHRGTLRVGHRRQIAEHPFGVGQGERRAMDPVGVVAIQPERDRLHRGRGPRHGHEGSSLPHRHGGLDPEQGVRRLGRQRSESSREGGSRRTWRSVRRTLPICVEIACSARPGSVAHDELGRTAADVLDQERAVGRSSPCVPPRNESPASCSPVMISGATAAVPAHGLDERLAVRRRRARRSWRPRGCARPRARGLGDRTWRAPPRCGPAAQGPGDRCGPRPCPAE